LSELLVGSRARVVEVKGGGRHQRRMLDMGLVPGAEVRVIRKASLGDPVEYGIKGTAIAMRRTDADSIVVEEVRDG
jgi:ferrous iron transport protein A